MKSTASLSAFVFTDGSVVYIEQLQMSNCKVNEYLMLVEASNMTVSNSCLTANTALTVFRIFKSHVSITDFKAFATRSTG